MTCRCILQVVKKVQWFDETSGVGKQVRGKRVLIMDEVDDTRTTLKYCVEEGILRPHCERLCADRPPARPRLVLCA